MWCSCPIFYHRNTCCPSPPFNGIDLFFHMKFCTKRVGHVNPPDVVGQNSQWFGMMEGDAQQHLEWCNTVYPS